MTNPINELDLISEIQKQGKDKKWINPKRYPITAGVHMVNQISFISSQFTERLMISLSLLLLLIQAATGQE